MTRYSPVAVALALLFAACGDDPAPPAADDTGVDNDTSADTTDTTDTTDADTTESDTGGEDTTVEDAAPPLTCEAAPMGQDQLHPLGDWNLVVDTGAGSWRVLRGDATVLEGPPACVDTEAGPRFSVRAVAGEPHVRNDVGAFLITLEGGAADTTWTGPLDPTPTVTSDDASVSLTWTLHEEGPLAGTVTLRFATHGEDLEVALSASDPDAVGGELITLRAEDDAFFGLGSQVTGMDLSGRTYPLWTQEQGIGKPDDGGFFPLEAPPEAAYAPMGIWHSSGGYTALVNHDAYSELDLGETVVDRVALRSYAAQPGMVLMSGDTVRDRLSHATEYIGRPSAPPAWLFAPWNDAVGGPERLDEVSALLRDNDIPSSAIWTEDWIGGDQTASGYRLSYAWAWDEDFYPDLPTNITSLHANGFAFLGYFNTFVPEPTAMWDEGVAGGWLATTADGELRTVVDPAFRTAGLVDLTDPGAVAWLEGYLTTAADTLGLDGWMADFTEWWPVDAVTDDGASGWTYHNVYPLDWQRANREVMTAVHADDEPSNNWTYFVRSGWASIHGGTGGIAPAVWGGDQNTNWAYDDGLPTVIPIGAHLGMSGVSVFGSDIAGYSSFTVPNTDKELFFRWTTVGALHPLMRTHHGSDECGNWTFDRDDASLAHYRRWAKVHTLLYPTFRALAEEATATGLPIIRHPYLVAPDTPLLWRAAEDYTFFIGDDLLVAPIMTQGATSRDVSFPSGLWHPLFGGSPQPGPATLLDVEVPYTELAVYVRGGAVLALLGDPVDSFYGASDEHVTDLSDVSDYRAVLYPDGAGDAEGEVAGNHVTLVGHNGVPLSAATIEGALVPACPTDIPPTTTCLAGEVLYTFGSVALDVGLGHLTVAGDGALRVAFADAGWGEWGTATDAGDIHAEVPPPCE